MLHACNLTLAYSARCLPDWLISDINCAWPLRMQRVQPAQQTWGAVVLPNMIVKHYATAWLPVPLPVLP